MATKSCDSRTKDQIAAFRDACPCGHGSDALAYRCADPRVMPPKLVVSLEELPALIDGIFDETTCGELLPPPLPPPKSPLV